MHDAKGLYDRLYPQILRMDLPKSLLICIESSLDEDPKNRTSFMEMYVALEKDKSSFAGVDEQFEAVKEEKREGDEVDELSSVFMDDSASQSRSRSATTNQFRYNTTMSSRGGAL
jgi:hypothetical protein